MQYFRIASFGHHFHLEGPRHESRPNDSSGHRIDLAWKLVIQLSVDIPKQRVSGTETIEHVGEQPRHPASVVSGAHGFRRVHASGVQNVFDLSAVLLQVRQDRLGDPCLVGLVGDSTIPVRIDPRRFKIDLGEAVPHGLRDMLHPLLPLDLAGVQMW